MKLNTLKDFVKKPVWTRKQNSNCAPAFPPKISSRHRRLLAERGVEEPYRSRLLQLADMFGERFSLSSAKEAAGNPRSLAAIEHLEKLNEVLKLYGVAEYVSFDLGMLSKYKYYTGVIFKAYTYGVGDAIVKGGRYDKLLRQFGKDAPSIGFCMVVDSILEALSGQKVKLIPEPQKVEKLYYTPENYQKKLARAIELRSKWGIPVALIPEDAGGVNEDA